MCKNSYFILQTKSFSVSLLQEKEERYLMLFPNMLIMLSASPRMSGFIYQVSCSMCSRYQWNGETQKKLYLWPLVFCKHHLLSRNPRILGLCKILHFYWCIPTNFIVVNKISWLLGFCHMTWCLISSPMVRSIQGKLPLTGTTVTRHAEDADSGHFAFDITGLHLKLLPFSLFVETSIMHHANI